MQTGTVVRPPGSILQQAICGSIDLLAHPERMPKLQRLATEQWKSAVVKIWMLAKDAKPVAH